MKRTIKEVLSNGYILGTIKSIPNTIAYNKESSEIESLKLKQALKASIQQIRNLKKENRALEEYLTVQELMISDVNLEQKALEYIAKDNVSATIAIHNVIEEFSIGLIESNSTYLQQRATDLEDIGQRIISNLEVKASLKDIHPYILYTDILYPSFLISHRKHILGIIVKKGGYTSHTAILCRSWDIPYIISDEEFKDNDVVIIDTGKNLIIKNSNNFEINEYSLDLKERLSFEKKAIQHNDFLFLANVGSNLDLKRVIDYDFDGVGLYRTEMIFMNTDRPYSFNEQYNIYLEAIQMMKDKMICFRTFDIGDDKQLSYLKAFNKGIDNYKNNPLLFIDQVKALLKANIYGNMRIMFPMIETKEEFLYLKRWVLKIREENHYNMPKIGMMLETKKALENIEDFIDADFISIGTNDLTAELYHMERDFVIKNLDDYLLDLVSKLKKVVDFCDKNNICLSVCGELASVRKVAKLFYEMGIKNLSVAPSGIRMLNLAYTDYQAK